jgi:HEAT repeat protein
MVSRRGLVEARRGIGQAIGSSCEIPFGFSSAATLTLSYHDRARSWCGLLGRAMDTLGNQSACAGKNESRRGRRFQTGVRTLVVLVAVSGVIIWAARRLWENYDPVLVETRSLQQQALSALHSVKPAERVSAIHNLELLQYGNQAAAMAPLVGALGDPEAQVRSAAAEALALMSIRAARASTAGDEARAAEGALVGCLEDQDSTVRLAVVRALDSIADVLFNTGADAETLGATAQGLIECAVDPEPVVRSVAATALGKLRTPRIGNTAVPAVDHTAVARALNRLLGDRDANVRNAAIKAIAWRAVGSEPPRELAQCFDDPSAENRAAAAAAVLFFRQGLDPFVPVLLRLAERDPEPKVRMQCITALNSAFKPPAISDASLPALLANLRSSDRAVRSQAAAVLGTLRADAASAIPQLLAVLHEPLRGVAAPVPGFFPNADPACEAARALGMVAPGSGHARTVIAALIETASTGPISRRGSACDALGEFGPAAVDAVPTLIKLVKDAAPHARSEYESSAALALGKIAADTTYADRAVAALVPVLGSDNAHLRACAIKSLGVLGPRSGGAISKLCLLKDDRDAEVRDAAARALAAIENGGAP